MTKPTLGVLASEFHQRLKTIKSAHPLDGVEWYPWVSLAAMETLDGFLGGDVEKLRGLIGGAPVLDVGCGDGDVGFFLESLGGLGGRAIEVDAIDHAPTNYNALVGVRALKQLLNSRVGIHEVDLDRRPRLPGPSYGLTIMLGVLYHLKNPFLVLEELARHSRHIFLSTRIASLTPGRKVDFGALPMAYLVDEDELNSDPTNFWIFSEAGLKRVVRRSGWDVRHYVTLGAPAAAADPVSPQGDVRAYILAESRLAAPSRGFRLERGWHELEYNSWRWTQRRFSAVFDVPDRLAPATLRFVFYLPQEALTQRPAVTLSATVNGSSLAPQTFSAPGQHEYEATLASVAPGSALVEFELDQAIGPSSADQRELGVFVDFAGAPALELERGA